MEKNGIKAQSLHGSNPRDVKDLNPYAGYLIVR